jgi:hypothetical protein
MRNRNAKFVSAIFASTLAGASVEALTQGVAHAAADCLSAPKGASPAGSHWYYRVDRATKRHCWYLGEADGKVTQSAPPKFYHSPKPLLPVARTSVQRPIADARAELPPQATAGASRNEAMTAVAAAPADWSNDGSRVDALPPSSVIATRWPEPTGVSPAVSSPVIMASNLPADVQSKPTAPPPSAIAAAPLVAAEAPQGRSASIPMLLSVMTGALALAGITASIVLKLGGARSLARSRAHRDGIWEYADDDRIRLSTRSIANILPRGAASPRDLDEADETEDRVTEFYRKLSERTPSHTPSRTPS